MKVGLGFGADLLSELEKHDLIFLIGPYARFSEVFTDVYENKIGIHGMIKYNYDVTNYLSLNIGTRHASELWNINSAVDEFKWSQQSLFIGMSVNMHEVVRRFRK